MKSSQNEIERDLEHYATDGGRINLTVRGIEESALAMREANPSRRKMISRAEETLLCRAWTTEDDAAQQRRENDNMKITVENDAGERLEYVYSEGRIEDANTSLPCPDRATALEIAREWGKIIEIIED